MRLPLYRELHHVRQRRRWFQAAGGQDLLRRLKRDNPNIENSIFRSIHAVALDTMPGYKSEGVEHSFLERFNAMEAASDENE